MELLPNEVEILDDLIDTEIEYIEARNYLRQCSRCQEHARRADVERLAMLRHLRTKLQVEAVPV